MTDQTTAKLADKRGSSSHQLNPHYYAFYLGPALVLSINMEVYVALYNDTLNKNLKKEQETWMNDRLRAANTPEKRKKHPWIIVLGHQPLYCSSSRQDGSCTTDAEQVSTFLCVFKMFYKIQIFFCRLATVWRTSSTGGAWTSSLERTSTTTNASIQCTRGSGPYSRTKTPIAIQRAQCTLSPVQG